MAPTTWELDGSAGTASDLTPATAQNQIALTSRVDTTNFSDDVPTEAVDTIHYSWSTASGDPNVLDWPSGDYIGSLEIASVDSGVSFKIQLLQVQSGGTIRVTLGTSGSISGTGVQSHTVNTDPASGATGDRFQMRILASNTNKHGNNGFVITTNDPDSIMTAPFGTTYDETGRTSTISAVTSVTDQLIYDETGLISTISAVTTVNDVAVVLETGRTSTILAVTSVTDQAVAGETARTSIILAQTSVSEDLLIGETGLTSTILAQTSVTDQHVATELGLLATILVATSVTDGAAVNELALLSTILAIDSVTDSGVTNELLLSSIILAITSVTDDIIPGSGGGDASTPQQRMIAFRRILRRL